MAGDLQIPLFTVERLCQPDIDVSQLTLSSDVDRTESVFTSKFVKLANASLPGSAIVDSNGAQLFYWDLFLILKYQQKWTPCGYGLGELLYTVSLMPDEELTLELKTWETSKTQQDVEDTTDQKNVSDIKDSNSASSEVSHTGEQTTNTSVNGKAGYSGFGFSASIEAGWSQNVKETQAENAKQTRDRSRQSTNEYKASHKVKLAVSREQGSESKTTRKIRNINRAHTLNANYYEILNQYDIELSLVGVPLAILGPEAELAADVLIVDQPIPAMQRIIAMLPEGQQPKFHFPTFPPERVDIGVLVVGGGGVETPPAQPNPPDSNNLTLGRLIRYSQSPAWVDAFIDQNGFSPIKLLYELWSEQLYLGAVPSVDILAGTVTDQERTSFRDGILQFVRPIEGWVGCDETGKIRWGYEVVAGKESGLLQFLYPLLPNSPTELTARIVQTGVDAASARDLAAQRFSEASENLDRRSVGLSRATLAARAMARMDLPTVSADVIATAGVFMGKTIEAFSTELPAFIQDVLAQLNDVRSVQNPVESWQATLPTQGVYADLTLGICSGAEDYLEIQRQFDLENQKLEVEKLQAEIDKLKLETQRLQNNEPSLIVESDADETSVHLHFTSPADVPPAIKVQSPGP
jgi:hypothetical protein